MGSHEDNEAEVRLSPAKQYLMYAKKLAICIVYVVFSALLIRFNKTMMRRVHFPHAMALSAIHMVVSSIFCSVLYVLFPALFPGMKNSEGNRLGLLKWFIPIAFCFAVMLVGSNEAYMFCSVTFLQFMKEANVMLVFVFSCFIGLQSFSRLKCLVIVWVIVGASIAVSGEIHFKWVGFIYQAVSQLAEVARMLISEMVLSGQKLDPLTYTMLLAPICCLLLVVANAIHWDHRIMADFSLMWPLIFANACVAFGLNILVAAVIKECSAVGLVLCGLTKDIVIVVFSAWAFHEHVTHRQVGAFVVTIAGVFFWSYMKIYPTALPVQALERILCVDNTAREDEKQALIKEAGIVKKV